jgi:hypothetical protein
MMEIQKIIVAVLFLIALIYVARMVYRTVNPKTGCGECFKCDVDFSNVKSDKN